MKLPGSIHPQQPTPGTLKNDELSLLHPTNNVNTAGVCRLRFGDDEAYGEALELEDLGEAVMKEMTRQAGGCEGQWEPALGVDGVVKWQKRENRRGHEIL